MKEKKTSKSYRSSTNLRAISKDLTFVYGLFICGITAIIYFVCGNEKPTMQESKVFGIRQNNSGDQIICVGEKEERAFISFSKDTGNSWQFVSVPGTCRRLNYLDIDWKKGMAICVGSDRKIYFSSDFGGSWDSANVNPSSPLSTEFYQLSIDWNTGRGFCGGSDGKVLETSDYGHHWAENGFFPKNNLAIADTFSTIDFDWKYGYGLVGSSSNQLVLKPGSPKLLTTDTCYLTQTLDSGKTWARYATNFKAHRSLAVKHWDQVGYISIAGITRDGDIAVMLFNMPGYQIGYSNQSDHLIPEQIDHLKLSA